MHGFDKTALSGRRLLGLVLACASWPGWVVAGPAVPLTLPASTAVAFVNVNVVPMDAERVLERHTVVVRDGRIAEVGPAENVAVPPDAERIQAEGWFLMPGLAEMHTHFASDDRDWQSDLFLLLANGVTTVREMWGSLRYLRWRDYIAAGVALGPRLYVCSPGMDGAGGYYTSLTPPVTTPQEARRLVAYYRALGFDFIKVYSDLTLEVHAAIAEEARAQGIRVVGHVPRRVGWENVLAAGQASIEHLWNFPEGAFSNGSLYSGVLDVGRFKEMAARIRDGGVWITPTLAVSLVLLGQVPALRERPEMRYVSPAMKRWFDNPLQSFRNSDLTLYEANLKAVLKVLEESGVKLLLGVDSGVRYVLPGFSIHDELRLRVEAGLSPYQVLRTGTANVAEFLQSPDYPGTVEAGKRADLLLLRGNPLEDVRKVGRRVGVMVGGLWLSEEWLRERLEGIARGYGN